MPRAPCRGRPRSHLDGWSGVGITRRVFRRQPEPQPITRDEVTDLILLVMGIDWKFERITEELEIENGSQEED